MRHRVCTASTELSDPVSQQGLAGRGWNAPLDFKKGSGPVVLHSSIHLILLGSAYLCCQIPDGLECAVHKVQLDIPDIRVVAI